MIRILRNGLELELMPDATLEIEWESWLFSDDDDLGKAFSYPISFPLSDSNKIFLEHRHLVQRIYAELEVSVQLYGFLFSRCLLSYRIEGPHKASGNLKLDESEVNSKLRDKTLQDIISETVSLGKTVTEVRTSLLKLSAAPPSDYSVVFAPLYNPEFLEKDYTHTGFIPFPYVNYFGKWLTEPIPKFFVDGEFTMTVPILNLSTTAKFSGYHLVPFPYLTWVLRKIFDWLGLTVISRFLEDDEIKRRVIYNNVALESLLDRPVTGVVMNVQDHLPRMKVLEFLKAIRKHFALQLDFNSRNSEVHIKSFKELQESDEYQDLSKWLIADDIILDPPTVLGYTVKFQGDTSDKNEKEIKRLESTTIGDGSKAVTDEVGTLPMLRAERFGAQGQSITGNRWLVPTAKQPGNLRGFLYVKSDYYVENVSELKNDFKLRLMTYRGYQKDSAGAMYPMLSTTRYDWMQVEIGKLADDPSDNRSVFETYQRPYYTWLAAARMTQVNFLMPVAEFLKIKLFKKIGVRGKDLVLTKFIIDKLVTQLPGYGGELKVKVYAYPTLPGVIGPNTADTAGQQVWLRIIPVFSVDTDLIDFYLHAYTTADQTRPLTLGGLQVFYRKTTYVNNTTSEEEVSVLMTGSVMLILDDFQNYYPANNDFDTPTQITVSLIPNPNYFIID